jgi:hypothetical protein
LYTPGVALTLLTAIRIGAQYRPAVGPISMPSLMSSVRTLTATAVVAAFLMSPLLFAFGVRVLNGQLPASRTFWRSSPSGVDVAAVLTPNPNHPLAPAALRDWIAHLTRPDYVENVASLSFVALAAIAVAMHLGWRAPAVPAAIAIGFGLLALGPFVRIAGVQTYVPGPWALLRYVPVVGLVRSPGRFLVFAMLGIAALFAAALTAIVTRWPAARRPLLVTVSCLLFAELLPAPRPIFSAAIPSIYQQVANDPRDVRVIELPFGIRDGTMAMGNFTARTQFFQTAHHKPIIGGYVSRLSQRRVRENQRNSVLSALIRLSEGAALAPDEYDALLLQWPEFARRTSLGYIVVDRARSSSDLERLPSVLGLEYIAEDGAFALYRPRP